MDAPKPLDATDLTIPLSEDKRLTLITSFKKRYGFTPPLNYQPSEQSLKILIRAHQLRVADFISLSKISSLAENRSSRTEPHKIHLSKTAELVLGRDQNTNRRNNDFLYSGDALIAAVRTLMYGYVLASRADPPDDTWCDLDSALSHISELENFVRLNSRDNLTIHQKLLTRNYRYGRNGHVYNRRSRGSHSHKSLKP